MQLHYPIWIQYCSICPKETWRKFQDPKFPSPRSGRGNQGLLFSNQNPPLTLIYNEKFLLKPNYKIFSVSMVLFNAMGPVFHFKPTYESALSIYV